MTWPGVRVGGSTVFRAGPTNATLNVFYLIGGTASNGVDYETLSGEITIPIGALWAPSTTTPIDDDLVEGPESVVIALTVHPTLSLIGYLVGSRKSAR